MIPSPSPAHGPAACPACPSQGPLSFLFNLRVTSSLVISAKALEDGPAGSSSAPYLFLPAGASLPSVLGLWEWWPAYPVPKAKNTKYLLSPQHLCPPLPAVASVYREISYWPCHSTLLPSVHGIPGPPPASLLSSGTAQALNHPVPSGGIFQAPSSGTRASQKGSLDLFAWSWRD